MSKLFKRISLLSAFSMLVAPFVLAAPITAAITATSITGTGISANSSLVTTPITPVVSFTLGTGLSVDGQTIHVILNGATVVTGQSLTVANLSLTCNGGSARTLEAAPGTPDNGSYEVTIVNGASTNNNPDITIAADNAAGPVAPTCSGAVVLSVITAGKLQSSTTAANYSISIATPFEATGFFYYVGNENQVTVNATVDPSISFVIRNTADTLDQSNVNNAAVGPNLCDLGNLSTAGIQSCSYRLKVATNAASGYTVNVATDGNLRQTTPTVFIANIVEDSTNVTAGVEGYGIQFASGASNVAGSTVAAQGNFTDNDTPLGTGVNTTLYTSTGPNNPTATDTTNTALVTHRAEASAGTPSGTYTQLVTYTVTGSF